MLSKGEHKIDGKTYKVDKNLYDTVPKDNKNGIYESINMGKLMCTINVISYETTYPRVNAKKYGNGSK